MKKFSSLDEMFYGTPNEPADAETDTPKNTKSGGTSTDIKQTVRNIKLQTLDDLFGITNSGSETPVNVEVPAPEDTPPPAELQKVQQSKDLLPSEKALYYKSKLDAIKCLMSRPSKYNASPSGMHVVGKQSLDILGEQVGESRNQIYRYLRLTKLIPALQTAVDEKKIGLNVGATLSFLRIENQKALEAFCFQTHSICISQSLANRLRQIEADGARFTPDILERFVAPSGKNLRDVMIPYQTVQHYFPEEMSSQEITQTIQNALQLYFTKERTEHSKHSDHP